MKNIPEPKVSVLMPVYNAGVYLREAIESILDQTYLEFEFIIINDGSTDNSKEIILSYNDPRIKYFENKENLKLITTLNKGLEIASGKYIVRMDADDISLPNRIEKQVKFMDSNPEVALCGSWFKAFGESNQIGKYATSNDDIRIRMLYQTQFCHPSVIIRKDILTQNKYKFDFNFIHAEDYELFVRISEKYKVANIPEVLLKYRQHVKNVSTSFKQTQVENSRKIIQMQFNEIGIEISLEEQELYSRFCYSNFSFSMEEINKLLIILKKIIESNKVSKYLSVAEYPKYLSKMWFHLCYNTGKKSKKNSYSIYKNSEIKKYYYPGIIHMLKFYLKDLFY